MADETGGAGETSHIRKGLWPSILIPKLELVLANMGVVQNLQHLELGKAAFPVVTTTTTAVGLLFSPSFPAHYLVVVGFVFACAVLWNGVILGTVYPHLGSILQLLGTTLIFCVLCFLVASFLPHCLFLAMLPFRPSLPLPALHYSYQTSACSYHTLDKSCHKPYI